MRTGLDTHHNYVTRIHYTYITVGTVGQSRSLAFTDTENWLAYKSSKPRLGWSNIKGCPCPCGFRKLHRRCWQEVSFLSQKRANHAGGTFREAAPGLPLVSTAAYIDTEGEFNEWQKEIEDTAHDSIDLSHTTIQRREHDTGTAGTLLQDSYRTRVHSCISLRSYSNPRSYSKPGHGFRSRCARSTSIV